jgi:hypothetical protein
MTSVHDFPSNVVLGQSIPPNSYDDVAVGEAIDLKNGDGPVFVIVSANVTIAAAPIGLTFEESNDLSAWSPVVVATLPSMPQGFQSVAMGRCQRMKRFLRARLNPGDSGLVLMAVLIGQQLKTI